MRVATVVLLGATVLAACARNPEPATAPQPAAPAAPPAPAARPPAAPAPAPAAAPSAATAGGVDLSGSWNVAIDLGGQSVPAEVSLTRSGTNYTGTITAGDQGGGNLQALTIEGDRVTMTFSGPNGDAVFRGTLSTDRRNVAGNLDYGGQTFPFSMTKR